MAVALRGLYVIADPAVARGREVRWLVAEAIAGGARLIQWRDKTRDKGLQLPELLSVVEVCRRASVPLLVNDHADLALAGRADGVHVGQDDLPVAVVRALGATDWIVGVSTNNLDEARQAEADGASYVAVGNLFGSMSKSDTRPATLELLSEVVATVSLPVCGIGGIDKSNIRSVIGAGAHLAAVITAVVAADDPRAAATVLAREFVPHRD